MPKIHRRALSDFAASAEFLQEDSEIKNPNGGSSSAVAIKTSEEETCISSTTIGPKIECVRPERIYVTSVNPLEVERIEEENFTKVGLEESRSPATSVPEEEKESALEKEAWNLLRAAVVNYCGSPIGTVAANDSSDTTPLNYDQVFIRDFVPSALAFMLK